VSELVVTPALAVRYRKHAQGRQRLERNSDTELFFDFPSSLSIRLAGGEMAASCSVQKAGPVL
jgi:hypothetical protein